MPLPVSNDPVTDQGRLYVSPSLPVGDGGLPIAPVADPDAAAMANVPTDNNDNVPNVATRVINKLLGTGGEERYKTWPEKLLRDALSAPHDVLNSTVPSTSGDLIKPALDMSALAGTGGLGGVGEGAIRTLPEVAKDAIRYYHGGENPTSGGKRWLTPSQEYAKNYGIGNKEVHYVDLPIDKAIELGGYDEINSFPRNFNAPENIAKNLKSVTSFLNSDVTLGSSPFLRPALRYEGKIYKAPMGGEHMDAIPETLRPEFTKQAMSGEDISNFNFGFMNHKGQFLDREKALKYAIDEGLLSPHDAKYGALTSTLMSDNQSALATRLNPTEETEYQKWKTKNAPNDTGSDYDLKGAFKAGLNPAENGHFPDTYKLPSHPTFSDESKYSTKDTSGGHWEKTKEGWNFTPSATNLKYHSREEIQDYLNHSDPTVTLK